MSAAIEWLSALGVGFINISMSLPAGAADYAKLCATIAKEDKIFFTIAAGNSGPGRGLSAACAGKNKLTVGAARNGVVEKYSGDSDLVRSFLQRRFRRPNIGARKGTGCSARTILTGPAAPTAKRLILVPITDWRGS